jgi:ABC-type sugar transport system substrate-binding protein
MDADKQVSMMQDLITKKVDGICSYTINPELDVKLAQMCADAKIPLVFENSKPADAAKDYVTTVACQYDDIGYAVGKYIGEN